jgi:hypothetical protein
VRAGALRRFSRRTKSATKPRVNPNQHCPIMPSDLKLFAGGGRMKQFRSICSALESPILQKRRAAHSRLLSFACLGSEVNPASSTRSVDPRSLSENRRIIATPREVGPMGVLVSLIRCPYCVKGDGSKIMLPRDRGSWFLCRQCGHVVIPADTAFRCTCPNCIGNRLRGLH